MKKISEMQETELRLDMLKFLDDLDTARVKKDYKLMKEDIEEYRQYLKETTIINDKKSSDNLQDGTRL